MASTTHPPIIFDLNKFMLCGYSPFSAVNGFANTPQIYLDSIGYQGDDPDAAAYAFNGPFGSGVNGPALLNPLENDNELETVRTLLINNVGGSISFSNIRLFLTFDLSSLLPKGGTAAEQFSEAIFRFVSNGATTNFQLFAAPNMNKLSDDFVGADFRQANFNRPYSDEILNNSLTNIDGDDQFEISLNQNALDDLNSNNGVITFAIVDSNTVGHVAGEPINDIPVGNSIFGGVYVSMNYSGAGNTLPRITATTSDASQNSVVTDFFRGNIMQVQLSQINKTEADMLRDYKALQHKYEGIGI